MSDSKPDASCGRYALEKELASFPFGVLWEADDPEGGRVLLLLSPPGIEDAAAKAASARAAAASVVSPHVVPWIDADGDDDDGRFWLVAPLLGESSYDDLVESRSGLEPEDAASIAHQVARALSASERADVSHHALCGQFVRLIGLPEGGYAAKIYGFGLSGLLPPYRPLKKKDPFVGVPDYMAPEQCQGKAAASGADVYAVGVLMYQGIRGKAPFAARTAAASASTTLKRHIFEKPLALHMRFGGLDHIRPYESIAMKALAKQAAQRQPDCQTLESELSELLVDEIGAELIAEEAVPAMGGAAPRAERTQILVGLPEQLKQIAEEYEERERRVVGDTGRHNVPKSDDDPADTSESEDEQRRTVEKTMTMAGLSPEAKALADAGAREAAADAEAGDTDLGQSAVVEGNAKTAIDMPAVAPSEAGGAAEPGDKTDEYGVDGDKKKGKRKRRRGGKVDHAANTLLQQESVKPARRKTERRVSAAKGGDKATQLEAAAVADDGGKKPSKKSNKKSGKDSGRGNERRDKRTVLDFPALEKKKAASGEGDHDGWFVDAPEDLAPHHHADQKDHFAPSGKRSLFWLWAMLITLALVGVVWWLAQSNGSSGKVSRSESSAAKQVRKPTAAEAKMAKEFEAKKAREASYQEQLRKEKKARQREQMAADLLAQPAETGAAPAAAVPPKPKPKPTPVAKPTPAPVPPAAAKPGPTVTAAPAPTAAKPAAAKPVAAKPVAAKPAPAAAAKPTVAAKKPVAKKPKPKPKPKAAEPKAAAKPAAADPSAAADKKDKSRKQMKLGIQAYKSGDYKSAASHFTKARRLDATNHVALKYIKMAKDKMSD